MRIGAFAYVKYGWETSFNQGSTTRDKVYGRGQRVTGYGERHNLQSIIEFGDRAYNDFIFKLFEGSFAIEFLLANPWWFKALLGKVTTTGSSAPYTHTFTRDTTTQKVPSMELEVGFKGEVGDVARLLRGAVINSATISASVGEPVTVRLDIYYSKPVSGTISSVIVDSFSPFVSNHVTLEVPSGTTIAQVQNLELTINNNIYRLYELGEIYQVDALPQVFDVTGRMTAALRDASLINWVRGTQNTAAIKMVKDSNENITINLDTVAFEEFSLPLAPAEPVILELPFRAKDISSIVAKNSISNVP